MSTTLEKPIPLSVNREGIPAELTKLRQWVPWRYELRDGLWIKMPRVVGKDRNAKSNDSSTWREYDVVALSFDSQIHAGIAFMFDEADPYFGVDIDACRNPETGELTDWAAKIVKRCNTYTEVSPSGYGIKMIGKGVLLVDALGKDADGKIRTGKSYKIKGVPTFGDKAPEVAFFDKRRFWTMTGQHVEGTPAAPQERQSAIDELFAQYWPTKPSNGQAARKVSTSAPDDDGEVLARIAKASNAAKVEALLRGEWEGKYSSQSEADMALCQHLAFWCGPDPDRIDRMFRASGLMRGKWEDRADYREATISAAIERTSEFYNWGRASKEAPGHGKSSDKRKRQSTWKKEERTEAANARWLAEKHGDTIRWCEPWGKMLLWDGKRWGTDSERRADALAKSVAAELWDDVKAAEAGKASDKMITDLIRFAKASNSANGIGNMLRLVRSEPGIAILPDVLDRDEWLLNVENGTLDLRTGKLRSHRRDDYLTKLAPVRFDVDADCPTWLKFIDSTFDGNAALIDFVRRLAGYCLTGSTRDHVLPFLYGKGANGKSVLINTLLEVSGPDYAMKAPTDFLTMKRGEAHPTERADLHGKRLVAAIEAEEGRRLAESLVKELTGGDKVRARRMREDFWEFTATHKVMLASNHKPTIRGTDDGIWRRILLIPFTVRFWDRSRGESGPPELEADKKLPKKLLAEKNGILNWLVWGCIDWQANGLAAPDEVLIETDKYRIEMDVVGRFIDEHCVVSAEAEATAKDLYVRFQEWCKETGEFAIKQRQFGVRLTERGFERFKSNGTRYKGIALIAGF